MDNQADLNQQMVSGGQGMQVNHPQAPVIQATSSTVNITYQSAPQPEAEITTTPQNLPYSGVISFVGREQELKQIHEQLQERSTVAISAIAGMGGIGKTELALQYALKHCHEGAYSGGICWVRAREEAGTQIISFARSLLNLTPPDDLELAEKVRWCWGRWREGKTLLVLDDVQDYGDVRSFLPPQDSRFKVLMTSRSRFGSPVQELQLDVLSEAEALELLRSLVQDDRVDQELELAKQLCEWLGYLPLGVELVGRYLFKKRDLSIAGLWQRLQEKRLEAKAFKQAEPAMTASLGVAAAFELSWQSLTESAQQVAAVLSLFALVEIPWILVEQCLPEIDAEELEDIRDQVFLGGNLLKRVDQGMYQLHQLLREFFALKREQGSDVEELKRKFYEVVVAQAERVKKKPERSLIKESTVAIAHLQAVIELVASPDQVLNLATCMYWIAALYYKQGRYLEAEPMFLRSLSMQEQELGRNHPEVATSLTTLAALYRSQGRYAKAESLYMQSLAIREQQLGHDHPDRAQSLHNLAFFYYSEKRYAEAEPLYVQSLAIREQQLGHDHPDVAESLGGLAFIYTSQGRYTEAEPLYIRSLSIWKHQLGHDHPNMIYSLNGLAKNYRGQGRYAEAEPLFLHAVSILQKQFPVDHPLLARILTNLALLYNSQGRYREAEALYLQALPILSAKLEESHAWRREASDRFRSLLQKALQENRTDELSDDPMTRSLLQEIQNEAP